MTDEERDLIHRHILTLRKTDQALSDLLLHIVREREILLRRTRYSGPVSAQETCHDFEEELLTVQ